jgi:hypothetical protein
MPAENQGTPNAGKSHLFELSMAALIFVITEGMAVLTTVKAHRADPSSSVYFLMPLFCISPMVAGVRCYNQARHLLRDSCGGAGLAFIKQSIVSTVMASYFALTMIMVQLSDFLTASKR